MKRKTLENAHPDLVDPGNDHARRITRTAGLWALPQTVVYLVPEAGFEPARPHRAKDFKSPASAIPPLRHVSAASVEVSIRSIPRLHPVTPRRLHMRCV